MHSEGLSAIHSTDELRTGPGHLCCVDLVNPQLSLGARTHGSASFELTPPTTYVIYDTINAVRAL